MLTWKYQRIILIISTILLIGKFIAYFITNSAGVYTDAMESIVNVVAGGVSLMAIFWANRPKDSDHPFGHGKIEMISASFEGLLIILAGGAIIFEGIKRLFSPADIKELDLGIWIVFAAGLINYIVGAFCIRKGKKNSSMALVAEGKHLQSDTYSSIGLIIGLIVVKISGIKIIDSCLALLFGVIIIITGIKILKKTISNLVDKVDEKELESIAQDINNSKNDNWIDIHNLRVVSYGSSLHIDCDLTLPSFYTIKQGHEETEKLRKAIENNRPSLCFTVHSDACDESNCMQCSVKNCNYRQYDCSSPFVFNVKNLTIQQES